MNKQIWIFIVLAVVILAVVTAIVMTKPEQEEEQAQALPMPETMDVEVDTIPAQLSLCHVAVGPYSDEHLYPAWDKLWQYLKDKGGTAAGDRFAIYYTNPDITPPEECRAELCIPLEQEISAEGEFEVKMVPGGLFAWVLFKGPHRELGPPSRYLLFKWLPEQFEYEGAPAPMRHYYLNSPREVPQTELLTRICLPIQEPE